jgi:hypothetical protein
MGGLKLHFRLKNANTPMCGENGRRGDIISIGGYMTTTDWKEWDGCPNDHCKKCESAINKRIRRVV